MVWWTLGAGLVVGLILLVVVSMPVLRRLRVLRMAVDRSRIRAEEAQALQVRVQAMQAAIEAVQGRVEAITAARQGR